MMNMFKKLLFSLVEVDEEYDELYEDTEDLFVSDTSSRKSVPRSFIEIISKEMDKVD